jgi:hypothetical protein
MSRRDGEGTCEHCRATFDYYLVHNGFNDSTFGYCDRCGETVIVYSDNTGFDGAPVQSHHALPPTVQARLPSCSCGGRFRADAAPRCPACRETLSAERATSWLEAQALGTAGGWQWQRAWQGLYCIIIENRDVEYHWNDLARAV